MLNTFLLIFTIFYVVIYILIIGNMLYQYSKLPPIAQMAATPTINAGAGICFLASVAYLITRLVS